ncbi:tryptophan dimethylallyltransferase-domain-containing protein [Nemania abortiva]|nr:tryptophan dimethylallyltransferase-domain-containing protein [Nemania abortiva]
MVMSGFYIARRSRSCDPIPTVRYWYAIFPKFLDRLTYNSHAAHLVERGYRKYGNQPFRLLKMDMDLIVLPLRYASELRAVTSDKLDPLTASFDDNAGDMTNILLGSELHTHAIQRRLTPRLPQIIPILTHELRQTFHHVLPKADDDWVEIDPYDTVLRLSSRAAARVFVGEHICRDEEFLETVASYSRNIFDTIASNRSFGRFFMSFLGNWFSTVSDAEAQLQYVQRLLGSEVERRRTCPEEEHDDFIQWCMDLARTKEEAHPYSLAHRTLGILSMAVVHTTAMATTHILFDIVSNENLKRCLRKEQETVLKDGWAGISQRAMLDMRQLDSLMRESQRINPVGEFTFRRVVRVPITLSDGYQLNPGEQIAIPAKAINADEEILPDAHSFNPDRWDVQYWADHFTHPLKALLKATEAYTLADQEAQLRILADHVLPNLGPRPSRAPGPSYMTQSGSPIQLSLNASKSNCVRYCWDMLGARGGTPSDPLAMEATNDIVASLSTRFGFSTRWSDELLKAFTLSPREAQHVVDILPTWLQSFIPEGEKAPAIKRIPFGLTAFDLKGSDVSMKLYINPRAKEIATGIKASDIIWKMMRNMTPAFKPEAVDIMEKFVSSIPGSPIELVAIDCFDEACLSEARVKIYLHTRSNTFKTVREYVTLRGELCDQETEEGLEILRDIWHLWLQEPDGISGEDFEKPLNDASMLCQKLYFSIELQPGEDVPKVKSYLPTWNYVRSDEETISNYEKIFRKCGHVWGENGRYGQIFTAAFGSPNHGRKKPVHCDASYIYTRKKGVYQTLYFSAPLAVE